jgi:hypothetical protein
MLSSWDRAAAWIAQQASTLGQLALLCLGVHLAADRLDDHVLRALTALVARWTDTDLVVPAAWVALVAELAADAIFASAILLTDPRRAPDVRAWRRVRSVDSVVLPISLAGVILAGAWSLAMGIEDLLPPSPPARLGSGALGIAALLRFGWPAWARAVSHLDPARRWTRGLASALVLAPIGWLAWSHGVPIWGWLP